MSTTIAGRLPADATLVARRSEDFKQSWAFTDQNTGASLISASDTVVLTIRPIRGDNVTLTLSTTPTGAGSSLSGFNFTLGSFDVTIKSTDVDAIATALALSARQYGEGHWALDITGSDGIKLSYAHGAFKVEPNT